MSNFNFASYSRLQMMAVSLKTVSLKTVSLKTVSLKTVSLKTVPALAGALLLAAASLAHAQAAAGRGAGAAPAGVTPPPGYTIGQDDNLAIVFWREKDLSAEVVVRPDGMISLPLLNDIRAEGLTPDQLRQTLTTAAAKFVEEPTVTVVVKAINSRKVSITGQVAKPGLYPLTGPTTVLQLIATAGGVAEYADKEKILVIRTEGGKSVPLKFNYKEVMVGRQLQQNVELKPGDTIIVP
jgi:polysaccharide export outer membrane protein